MEDIQESYIRGNVPTHSPSAAVLVAPVQLDRSVTPSAHSSIGSRLEWPFGDSERPYAASLSRRAVLLVFDDSAEAESAARVVDAIATRLHATVSVVSIVAATPVPIPFPLGVAIAMGEEIAGGTIHEEQERDIRDRLSALLARPIEWPTAIELGAPSDAIARQAARAKVALVVMGLRRHGRVDRAVHDETALSVMRKAAGPVLGVAAGSVDLPTSALVAMDFSRASVHAAATAATLMATGGRLTLAHVESMMESAPDAGEGVVHSLGLEAAFERLERALASDVLLVDHVVLHHAAPGMPSSVLLQFAEGRGIDLLVAGSARHGRLDRVLLGSVSAELVRDGRYSVLIVPPDHDQAR